MKLHLVLVTAMLFILPLTTTYAGEPERDMQRHMEKMMQQMETIRNTKDLKLRSKLVEEHMQSMRKGMSMMGPIDNQSMSIRMAHMEHRMDMLQKMMDQMVQSHIEARKIEPPRIYDAPGG